VKKGTAHPREKVLLPALVRAHGGGIARLQHTVLCSMTTSTTSNHTSITNHSHQPLCRGLET
jgi:hypothetical protein